MPLLLSRFRITMSFNYQVAAPVIRISADDLSLLDTARAARHLRVKVADLRSSIKAMGGLAPGLRIKVRDRAVIFVSHDHPNPDCFMPGPFWRKEEVSSPAGCSG